MLLQRRFRDDQQRGRGVADSAGDRRGQPSAFAKRLQRGHLLQRRPAPGTLVDRALAQRHDFALETPLVDRAQRALVALEREALHVLARAVPLLRDHLGGGELRDLLRPVAPHPALRAAEGVLEAVLPAGQHGRRDRDQAHVLHAAGDDHVAGPAHHGLRREVHRLLRRAALAVDRGARNGVGQTRGEPAGARDVARLRSDGVHAAEDHVLDRQRIHARAFQECGDRVRAQIRGVHLAQSPAAPPDGRAQSVDDVGLGHGSASP